MPKANFYAKTLLYYIKSKVTLSAYTIYISHSSNTAVTRFRLQIIIKKNKFCRFTNWTLDSLFWNEFILKATVFSGAFYPINFNTECLWDSFSPIKNKKKLVTAISNAINSNL